MNLAARELRKHGTQIRLPGQPFLILSILLEKPGQVVSREELRERLWASDTFVDFEHSLNSAIKKLRSALGDSSENARYIETVPRVGYRFIAPVEEIAPALLPLELVEVDPAPEGITARPPQVRWKPLLIILCTVVVTALVYLVWARSRVRPSGSAPRLMLAVLPFENLTGDPAQEYLSDGLTEETIAQLGRLDPDHLGVIARTSVMHYKNSPEQLLQIGHELGVQYVLEGSVRRESDRVRVTAQLIQVKDQTHVWARQYDRDLSSLLALQSEIAQETADEIQLTLNTGRKLQAPERKPVAPSSYEAYDLYLRGRYFWNKRSSEGFHRAADYFQQSIAKDPNYAPAYAGLADTYALMSTWTFVSQNEYMPKARAAALRALEIDDSLAEAHTSLALIAENYDYDWQTAEKEYRRAIQLDPQYATAHQWYAECLSFQGRFDEALAESERARQLDPLSLIITTDHGAILYFSRNYDRAIEQFNTALAMEPTFQRAHMITFAYVEKGMYPQAIDEVEKWRGNDGNPVWIIEAFVYARAGEREKALRAFEKCKPAIDDPEQLSGIALPEFYVAIGRRDDAIAYLQKAYREHSNIVLSIKVDPALDPLRGDLRFQDLLRKVGLAN